VAEENQDEAEAPKGKSILPLVGIVVIAIAASVGATMFFLGGSEETEEVADVVEEKAKAIYHNLRPPFIVNFLDGNKPRYLQVDVTLMARDEQVVENVLDHTPLIRAQLIDLLTDQSFSDLQSHSGKLLLRELVAESINSTLVENGAGGDIEKVLLTNFVMQ